MTVVPTEAIGNTLDPVRYNSILSKIQDAPGTADKDVNFAQVFNVKRYGAVGDGVTNDGPAWNNARGVIPSGGGLLYVPSGNYNLATAFTFAGQSGVQLWLSPGTTLSGLALPSPSGTNSILDFRSGSLVLSAAGGFTLRTSGLNAMRYDPTTAAGYPRGRLGFYTSDNVFRSLFHIDGTDQIIMAADFAAISKGVFLESFLTLLMNNPLIDFANTAPAELPIYKLDVATNLLRLLYRQEGTPSQAVHQFAEMYAASNPVRFTLKNFAGTNRTEMSTGTAGNRGVLKMWDATLAAYRYVYIDNGALVISATEPT